MLLFAIYCIIFVLDILPFPEGKCKKYWLLILIILFKKFKI